LWLRAGATLGARGALLPKGVSLIGLILMAAPLKKVL